MKFSLDAEMNSLYGIVMLEGLEVPLMPTTDEREAITLTLPKSLVRQLDEEAQSRSTTREIEAEALIADGFRRQRAARESLDRLSALHRARLQGEGKLNQTEDEIWAELNRVREEVANELYPD